MRPSFSTSSASVVSFSMGAGGEQRQHMLSKVGSSLLGMPSYDVFLCALLWAGQISHALSGAELHRTRHQSSRSAT